MRQLDLESCIKLFLTLWAFLLPFWILDYIHFSHMIPICYEKNTEQNFK